MHSSLSHPHDHAAGVALQPVLPHLSGIPFPRLILLLGSYPYVCTHTFIYSHPLNPTWFLLCPHQGQGRQQKYSDLFLLLHFRCIFFYSIHNVFHSLFACKVAHVHISVALQVHSTHVHILPGHINVCLHPAGKNSTPNTVLLTLS